MVLHKAGYQLGESLGYSLDRERTGHAQLQMLERLPNVLGVLVSYLCLALSQLDEVPFQSCGGPFVSRSEGPPFPRRPKLGFPEIVGWLGETRGERLRKSRGLQFVDLGYPYYPVYSI